MRNIEVTRCTVLPSSPLLCDASCLCVDSDSGSIWAATKAGLCCIAGKEVGSELRLLTASSSDFVDTLNNLMNWIVSNDLYQYRHLA